ncbi:MAG: hypothetical protein ACXVEE_33635, partial [Polyangiales bacterium]
RQIVAAEQARVAQVNQSHATERQKLEAERAQAAHDLGQAVLPKLDAASIATAAQKTGLIGLPNENIPGQVEARRAWLAGRLGEISRDERFVNRELLRHPRTGSLMTAIAEAEEYRKPASETLTACQSHPRFQKLWDEGFGTEEQKTSWWRFSYWADRSAANELIAMFPGKTTFAEIREEYRVAVETVGSYDVELGRLRIEVAAGEALDREYAALYEEYQTLDARALEHTRNRIVQHLLTSDVSLVSQRLESSSALRLLFLRASGLAAKITYLDGIQKANVTEIQKELGAQQQKLDTIETRTRRRWAPMPLDKYQKLAEDRRPRYEKRWQRYNKVYTTVYTFDRWDRGRRFEDLLWWDLMTRGRYDGSYIHEVHQFHQTHPDYHFDPEDMKGSNAEFFGTDDHRGADTSDVAADYSDSDAAASSIEADTDTDARDESLSTDAS